MERETYKVNALRLLLNSLLARSNLEQVRIRRIMEYVLVGLLPIRII